MGAARGQAKQKFFCFALYFTLQYPVQSVFFFPPEYTMSSAIQGPTRYHFNQPPSRSSVYFWHQIGGGLSPRVRSRNPRYWAICTQPYSLGGGGAACFSNLLMHCTEVPGQIRSAVITVLFWMIHCLRNCDKHYCWCRFKPFYFTNTIKEQTLEFALKMKMKLKHKYNEAQPKTKNVYKSM